MNEQQQNIPVKGQIIWVRNDNDVGFEGKPLWQTYNFDHFNSENECVVQIDILSVKAFDNYSLTNPELK